MKKSLEVHLDPALPHTLTAASTSVHKCLRAASREPSLPDSNCSLNDLVPRVLSDWMADSSDSRRMGLLRST